MSSHYDEAFTESGELRLAYRAFQDRTGRDPFHPSAAAIAALTERPLGDSFTILPIPLILDDREYCETIAAGVRQRALALQALFDDVVCRESRLTRATSLPPNLFPEICEQHGIDWRDLVAWWQGKSREAIRFVYGPDLVRGPEGQWWVLEDNVGCLGGLVDSHLVVDRYLAATGTSLAPGIPTNADFARAVRGFLSRVGTAPGGRGVVALTADCSSEAARRRRVLDDIGIATPNTDELDTTPDAAVRAGDITAVVNLDLRGWSSRGELAAHLFGRQGVPLMTAPGVDLLGNKALLPWLDRIVAFYSDAEPILRTPPTELCHRLPDEGAGWVLKKSNGCQGAEVFFLDDMDAAARDALERTRAAWGVPARAIVQRRVRASTLHDGTGEASPRYHVELRPFAFVIGDAACLAGEHASGRALQMEGTGRSGNMSRGAQYLTVIREPAAPGGSERGVEKGG